MSKPRTFLFLQGPFSSFLVPLARELEARGHAVRKITVSLGDWFMWLRGGTTAYRGTRADWPAFLDAYYTHEGITDVLLLGDCRPYHVEAITLAQARGIAVHVTELGYLRPDWITIERDGMNSFSHFPRDPDAILKLAQGAPPLDPTLRYPFSFLAMAWWDICYNWPNVLVSPFFYPHYRWHAIQHPIREHWGWILRLLKSPVTWWRKRRDVREFDALHRPLFIFPLQLATDYQIRIHSPFDSMEQAIETVIASFARHAAAEAVLLIKPHPLDNGLVNWRKVVVQSALRNGCADRVRYIEGVDLGDLIRRCQGLVTINSTLGTAALGVGCPVIALGNAIFDVPGLTFQGPLDRFWSETKAPDMLLCNAFMRALAATIQVRGSYYSSAGMRAAARAIAERIDRGFDPLPRNAPQDRANVTFRKRF
jgi:capsular polysaccharide export protein